jgi:hypothetical protein
VIKEAKKNMAQLQDAVVGVAFLVEVLDVLTTLFRELSTKVQDTLLSKFNTFGEAIDAYSHEVKKFVDSKGFFIFIFSFFFKLKVITRRIVALFSLFIVNFNHHLPRN